MNKVFIIGNLVRDPEVRTTQKGDAVASFTVAVNRKRSAEAGAPEADFFRVTAWRGLAESCGKYLSKGKKVGVVGNLSLNQYKDANGLPRFSMEVQADEVEFLTPREKNGFIKVEDDEDLPFK